LEEGENEENEGEENVEKSSKKKQPKEGMFIYSFMFVFFLIHSCLFVFF